MGDYTKSTALAWYYIFAPSDVIKRQMKDAISRFHETKKDDSVMTV